jgi:sugar transferase (PEP-CTERM system associated)
MVKTLLILMGGDALMAVLALYFGALLHHGSWVTRNPVLAGDPSSILAFVSVVLVTTYFCELYSRDRRFRRGEVFKRIAGSLLLAFVIMSALYYLWPQVVPGRTALAVALLCFGLAQYLWHNRYPLLLKIPGVAQKVLILGVGPLAQQIATSLSSTKHNYVLAGFVQPDGEVASIRPEMLMGSASGLLEIVLKEKIDKIVISLSERRGILPVAELLQCKFNGIEIVDAMSFHEQVAGKLLIKHTTPGWFIFSGGFHITAFMRSAKRVLDLLFAAIVTLAALPVIPWVILAIRLDSPGPVLFRQSRVGERGKPFLLYKFRSMRPDAEAQTGAVWSQKNDPRVTAVGRFLRKTRLDEIPQLYNVLRGDMSFVGPRPERPEFVEQLTENIPYYSKRHSVKPGLTGWAQVNYSYGDCEEDALEKLRYDLYYIKHYSLILDLLIVLETVKVVLFGKGGR